MKVRTSSLASFALHDEIAYCCIHTLISFEKWRLATLEN
jgi:hypothetical protein